MTRHLLAHMALPAAGTTACDDMCYKKKREPTCSGLSQRVEDRWGDWYIVNIYQEAVCENDVCCASDEDDCCEANVGAIVGLVIALVVVVAGSIYAYRKYKGGKGKEPDEDSQPDSPAESPREEPDEEATASESLESRVQAATKAKETVEPSSFSKLTSFLFGEREEAPTEEEAAALPVVAEAEDAPSTEQPPPPPAKHWFSRESESIALKAEERHQRMADWYNDAPEAAALRAAWGEYPGTPDALQAWPGFVQVTNAFLDANPSDPEA